MMTPSMTSAAKSRRVVRDILLYSLAGGVLITVLKLTEYRFLIVEHSVEFYAGLIAVLFAALGIWLGLTLTRKKTVIVQSPAVVPTGGALGLWTWC